VNSSLDDTMPDRLAIAKVSFTHPLRRDIDARTSTTISNLKQAPFERRSP